MKLLITRPEAEARDLQEFLCARNIEAYSLPLVEISLKKEAQALAEENSKLIFVSRNAVLGYQGPLAGKDCFAVGGNTGELVQERGCPEVIYPEAAAGAEALLALPQLQNIQGQHFTIICGDQNNPHLENTLQVRGALVAKQVVYNATFTPVTTKNQALLQVHYDLIITTSTLILHRLAELAEIYNPSIMATPVTVLEGNMLQSARAWGFQKLIIVDAFENQILYESIRHPFSEINSRQ